MSKGKELEDYIDPENGLLHALHKRSNIFSDSEIDDLEKLKPYKKQNEKLLRRIASNIDSTSKQFIEALCEDEQDHIAKFIVTGGCETDSDEPLLPRKLRNAIDDNMFCLEKLIDTEKLDLLHKLVHEKCITPQHRERVIRSKPEDKAHELLIILQRRRYKDYFNFMECLGKTMQRNIVRILEKGGVTEIRVQMIQERSDKRDIEAELIRRLTGYVGEDEASGVSEDQKKIVDELLAELTKNDIYFIGACPGTSKGSMSMYLQGENDDPRPVLNDGCKSGTLKGTLENVFRFLGEIPNSEPPLVKEVTMGEHSDKHHATILTEQNAGKRTSMRIKLSDLT